MARLPELGIDALLVTRLPNVRYLTGFTGSNGQVLVSPGESVFLTDGRYTEQSRREVADLKRGTYSAEFAAAFVQACRDAGVQRVGFEAGGVTYRFYEQIAGADGVVSQTARSTVPGLQLGAGLTLCVRTSGGGGRGDPLDRDPALVLRDVRLGKVSPAHAETAYGVVVRDGGVDVDATRRLRAGRRAARG